MSGNAKKFPADTLPDAIFWKHGYRYVLTFTVPSETSKDGATVEALAKNEFQRDTQIAAAKALGWNVVVRDLKEPK